MNKLEKEIDNLVDDIVDNVLTDKEIDNLVEQIMSISTEKSDK